jgi:DNA helicase HerA-like ATPase
MLAHLALPDDVVFRIGSVIAVEGRTVRIKVDKTKNTSHLLYRGEVLKNVSVGGYIKIVKGFTSIIGKVDGEYITEERFQASGTYRSDREKVSRLLTVSLLGFFDGMQFSRGIKELPLIDNECFLLHADEFSRVHNFLQPGDTALRLGTLAVERGQPIDVGVNQLFASHIGIFGNTGSGKSYTLARLYHELFQQFKDHPKFIANAQFLLIDFNGEYVHEDDNVIVEQQYKRIYRLSTRDGTGDKLPVSVEMLNDAEFWAVFLEATEKTQRPFLRRAIDSPYLKACAGAEGRLKDYLTRLLLAVTTANDKNLEKGLVMNLLEDVGDCLDQNPSLRSLAADCQEHLNFHSQQKKYFYQQGVNRVFSDEGSFKGIITTKVDSLSLPLSALSQIGQVRLRIVLQYYDDIIRGFANREHLAPLVKRLDKRVDDLRKVAQIEHAPSAAQAPPAAQNFTVISLKDVNIHMRKVLPLLLCKRAYEEHKQQHSGAEYLNLIIDEAHNILSEESERESEQWKDYRLEVFEEIVKEGRKFGVFLTIASQRPADISPTILSQLHNYFLHRLINTQDIKAVERTVSYLDKVSFESLPILPTGTCIFAGLLATVPVMIEIAPIDAKFEPQNKTIQLTQRWT